jgi:hypothetical protein
MKLNPPQRLTVRVHELARELGWTSGQLLDELRQRGEFVKSVSSVLEAPVVRAIRVDFAAVEETTDPEAIFATRSPEETSVPRLPKCSVGARIARISRVSAP